MADFPPVIAALIASAEPILVNRGLLIELCTENDIQSAAGLSAEQKNAVTMFVRRRVQSQGMISPTPLSLLLHNATSLGLFTTAWF
jgi:hypothetical protein